MSEEAKKLTQEELMKAVDEVLDGLEKDETLVVKAKDEDEEDKDFEKEVEGKPAKKKKADTDEDDEDDGDFVTDKAEEDKIDLKKKKAKKAIEVDAEEYKTLLKKAQDFETLQKSTQETELKKAFSKIDELQKSLEELKVAPQAKVSVDNATVIEKGLKDGEKPIDSVKKSIMEKYTKLSKAQKAEIMFEDLIKKSVDGVSPMDVHQMASTDYLSNPIALEKTLEAIGARMKDGRL